MSDNDKREGFKAGVREPLITDIFMRAAMGKDYNEGFQDGEAERARMKEEARINKEK